MEFPLFQPNGFGIQLRLFEQSRNSHYSQVSTSSLIVIAIHSTSIFFCSSDYAATNDLILNLKRKS